MKKLGDAPVAAATGRPPQYPIESVDNALKILLLLGERNELRLTEVAEYLQVATSTAHRLLAMLQYRGFMRQDPRTRAYLPGTALTGVAFSILQKFDVRGVLHPFVESLNSELAETVHLAILEGTSIRFIDAIESPQATRVASRIGRLMPANCTSTGKALLSELSVEELERLYPAEELPVLKPNSIGTRSALKKELEKVRRLGYATSSEESDDGVCSVAVPLPARGAPMRLAFNVAVPIYRMNDELVQRIATALKNAAAEAADLLH
jgi:DNA-binding IclR family transcriptional regulator